MFRLFGQKIKKSNFSQKVALFDFSGQKIKKSKQSSSLLKVSLKPTSFPRTGSAWACVLEQLDAKETNRKP